MNKKKQKKKQLKVIIHDNQNVVFKRLTWAVKVKYWAEVKIWLCGCFCSSDDDDPQLFLSANVSAEAPAGSDAEDEGGTAFAESRRGACLRKWVHLTARCVLPLCLCHQRSFFETSVVIVVEEICFRWSERDSLTPRRCDGWIIDCGFIHMMH